MSVAKGMITRGRQLPRLVSPGQLVPMLRPVSLALATVACSRCVDLSSPSELSRSWRHSRLPSPFQRRAGLRRTLVE
jgi:hypothetical protein